MDGLAFDSRLGEPSPLQFDDAGDYAAVLLFRSLVMLANPGESRAQRLDEFDTWLSTRHNLVQEGASSFVGAEELVAAFTRRSLALEEAIREGEKQIARMKKFLEETSEQEEACEELDEPFPWPCLEISEAESEEDPKVPDTTFSSVVGGASGGLIETTEPFAEVNRAFTAADDWLIVESHEIEPSIAPFNALSGSPPMTTCRSSRKIVN
jgi:hypothetical protein